MPAPLQAPRYNKDPKEILDYGFDWTLWLNGDSVLSSTWSLDPGIIQQSSTFTSIRTTVFLAGGVTGASYKCTNLITTAATPPRTGERSLYIDCVGL